MNVGSIFVERLLRQVEEASLLDSTGFRLGLTSVRIEFDKRTGEMRLYLGPSRNETIPLWLFLEDQHDPEAEWAKGLMLSTNDRAAVAGERLGSIIHRHSKTIGGLTPFDFARLSKLKRKGDAAYWRSFEFEQAMSKAEKMWANGQFAEYVRLLTTFREQLSPAQIKKIDVAKRRAGMV
jgi:hypothetical protein